MNRRKIARAVLVIGSIVAIAVIAAPAGAQSPPGSAETLFIEAQKSLARGNYEGAEKLLAEALARDPLFVSAVWQLAQIHESRGELDRARELLVRGLEIDPTAGWAREKLAQIEGRSADALLVESRRCIDAADWRTAAGKLSAYLKMRPADAEALASMARCQLALGNVKSARAHLDRARAADPANGTIGPLSREIERLERSSRIARLAADAERALAGHDPEAPGAARAALEALLDADPENAWAQGELRRLDQPIETRPAAPPSTIDEPVLPNPSPDSAAEIAEAAGPDEISRPAPLGRILLIAVPLVLAGVAGAFALGLRRRVSAPIHPLQGSLSLVPVLDVVALLSTNTRTGLLVIESQEESGEIYFEKGEIIHARAQGLSGKQAFRRLLEMRVGRFHFRNHLPAVRRSITEPLGLLLLAAKPEVPGEADLRAPRMSRPQPAGRR